MKINPILAAVFAVSLVVWLIVSSSDGGREAWDTGAYWSIGLPIIYLCGGLAAFVTRTEATYLALWSGLGQFTGLVLTASGLSLWPLGLIMLAVLTLPVLAFAAAARRLREWRAG